jgi:hypothetical protein
MRLISLAMLLATASACAIHHKVDPMALPEGLLAGRHGTGSVALANAQTSTTPLKVGSLGMYGTMYANLPQWTDTAVEVLSRKLGESGLTVSSTSSRKLALAVTDAEIGYTGGGFAWKCAVTLSIDTQDGLQAKFVGERAWWKYQQVCDRALSEAVAQILRDDRVLAWLGY